MMTLPLGRLHFNEPSYLLCPILIHHQQNIVGVNDDETRQAKGGDQAILVLCMFGKDDAV